MFSENKFHGWVLSNLWSLLLTFHHQQHVYSYTHEGGLGLTLNAQNNPRVLFKGIIIRNIIHPGHHCIGSIHHNWWVFKMIGTMFWPLNITRLYFTNNLQIFNQKYMFSITNLLIITIGLLVKNYYTISLYIRFHSYPVEHENLSLKVKLNHISTKI